MRVVLILLVLAGAGLAAGVIALPQVDAPCLVQRALHLGDDDRRRWSCLHYAAARGDADAIERIVAAGADVDGRNAAGRTPLAEAAKRGRLAAVQTLLRLDAEVDAYDTQSGFTPLHLAAENNHAAVVRRLLAASARVDARNQWNQTPLWQAAWQAWHGNTEVAHVLVARGAAVDVADDKGHTPLHMAARAGHTRMAAFLIKGGADLEHRSDKDLTPLYQAVVGGHPETVRLLLEHGADPTIDASGVTALELARRENRNVIADLLREHGARDDLAGPSREDEARVREDSAVAGASPDPPATGDPS